MQACPPNISCLAEMKVSFNKSELNYNVYLALREISQEHIITGLMQKKIIDLIEEQH